jgi:Ca-activated chloride channel homolog
LFRISDFEFRVSVFPMTILPHPLLLALAFAAAVFLTDLLHARRIRRARAIAFGPGERPRAWTRLAPAARGAAAGLVAWALAVLAGLDGSSASGRRAPAPRHLVALLDVSPSMLLADAGAEGGQTRADRAREVLLSVLERLPPERVQVTLVAFYTDSLPLVQRGTDREVVANFLDRMPLYYAFARGKTDLLKALNASGDAGRALPRGAAMLLVLSDGDTVSGTGLRPLPEAFAGAILAGVGDPTRGTYIDGHPSRQDRVTLSQLARRLRASYVDANVKNIPTALLRPLKPVGGPGEEGPWGLRRWALFGLAAGSGLLAAMSPLLQQFGSSWKTPRGGVR